VTRIVAGTARGRRLKVPAQGTRPTSERVREAVFSALEARTDLDGARVLDLYAGSGALGLEALSRGASQLLLVESDARAAAVAAANVDAVGLAGAAVRRAPVASVLAQPADTPYDLVLLDPPYSVTDAAVAGILAALLQHRWLAQDALVVLERAGRSPETVWPTGLEATWAKRYGDTRVEMATCYRPGP
jgi:16S rRNA (guanine966-N2)-methyltransferase